MTENPNLVARAEHLAISGSGVEGVKSNSGNTDLSGNSGPESAPDTASNPALANNLDNHEAIRAGKHSRRPSSSSEVQPETKKRGRHRRRLKRINALLRVEYTPGKNIHIHDLKNLLLYTMIEKRFSRESPICVTKSEAVSKIVFAFVPGIYNTDFSALKPVESYLPFFSNSFDLLVPFQMPGSKDMVFSCPQALLGFRKTKRERIEIEKKLRATKIVLDDLLLSLIQMKERNYPIHSSLEPSDVPSGWVETFPFDHDGSHTFALDCEFCKSRTGPVLTRVSLVNFQGDVVYDTYVKPEEEIIDYVTRFSGVTEEILEDVTTTAQDVQQRMLEIVSSTDILIGHSLESDLRVMQIRHPRVIDTSLIYDHPRGPPLRPGLKWLAQTHLARAIQKDDGSVTGHLSIEDLSASLDLVKLKLIEGAIFGQSVRETSLFEKVYEIYPTKRSVVIDYNPNDFGNDFGENANVEKIAVTSDDKAVKTVLAEMDRSTLMLMRLREIDFNSGASQVPANYKGFLHSDLNEHRRTSGIDEETRLQLLLRLNNRLQKVYDALPQDSLFIVCNEGGDQTELARLQKVRREFQKMEREQVRLSEIPPEKCWDFDKQTLLMTTIEKVREEGAVFATIKHMEDENDHDSVVLEIA